MTEGFERTKPVELPNWVGGKDDNTDWQRKAATDAARMPLSGRSANDTGSLAKSAKDSGLPGSVATDASPQGKAPADSSSPRKSATDISTQAKAPTESGSTGKSINETILESLQSKTKPDTNVQIQKPADAIEKFRAECAYTPLESWTETGLRAGWRGGTAAIVMAFLTRNPTGILAGTPTKIASLIAGVGVGLQTVLDSKNRQGGNEKTCFDAKIDDYFGIKKK